MTFLTYSPIVQTVSGLVADSQSSATANRTAIQAVIDSLTATGGGTAFIPEGTYYVNGTGTPSAGCIRLKTGVALRGAGRGVTIIKLVDDWSDADSGHAITGIIRTPTGEITQRTGVYDLTIDGNRHRQTLAISTITKSGTTATVTTAAAHGLATNDDITVDCASDELYNLHIPNITVTGASTFTYEMAGTPASNATAEMSFTARHKRGRQVLTGITVTSNVAVATVTASQSMGSNPIATTSGSPILVITLANHGYMTSSTVLLAGATTTNGVPDSEINANHVIFGVTKDTFKVRATTNANATSSGGGAGVTGKNHGLAVGDLAVVHGCSERVVNGVVTITAITGDTFSYAVTSANGAKTAGMWYSGAQDAFFCGVTPSSVTTGVSGASQKDRDISVINVEAKSCSRYGIDPHEQTIRFICRDSISWDNIYDGGIADYLLESEYTNCHFYMNGRQGLSVVTFTEGLSITNLKTEANGWHNGDDHGSGLILQQECKMITVNGLNSRFDYISGFRTDDASQVTATNLNISWCGQDGILCKHITDSVIDGFVIYNCSQITDNTYDGIQLDENGAGDASDNTRVCNGMVVSDSTVNHRRAIVDDSSDGAIGCHYENITSVGHSSDQCFDIDGTNSTAVNLIGSTQTTNATPKSIIKCEIAASSGVNIRVTGSAYNTTDNLLTVWDLSQGAKNVAATTSLVGTTFGQSTAGSTETVAFAADDSDDTLDFTVTGITSKTINWKYRIDVMKAS